MINPGSADWFAVRRVIQCVMPNPPEVEVVELGDGWCRWWCAAILAGGERQGTPAEVRDHVLQYVARTKHSMNKFERSYMTCGI